MKTFITFLIMIILFVCLIFLGMPFIIDKETGRLKSDIQELHSKIKVLEAFKSDQEHAWKMTGLKPGDDLNKVIKSISNLSSKIANTEDYLNQRISAVDDAIEGQLSASSELLAKHSETINNFTKDTASISQKVYLNAVIMNITAHILEAKIELVSKNIGNVKAALQVISDELEKAKNVSEDKNKKVFDELKAVIKNIKSELDVSLSGANNMINLFWYELEKITSAI